MDQLTQKQINAVVEQMIAEFGQEYIDFMKEDQTGEKNMEEELLSILEDEEMTDSEKLDAIREYLML